jgi:hypothetical protein
MPDYALYCRMIAMDLLSDMRVCMSVAVVVLARDRVVGVLITPKFSSEI